MKPRETRRQKDDKLHALCMSSVSRCFRVCLFQGPERRIFAVNSRNRHFTTNVLEKSESGSVLSGKTPKRNLKRYVPEECCESKSALAEKSNE